MRTESDLCERVRESVMRGDKIGLKQQGFAKAFDGGFVASGGEECVAQGTGGFGKLRLQD